jgi:P-type Ca2+ transporter type 2C
LYIYKLNSGATTIEAMTVAFTVFVMYQIFNVFNCKAKGKLPNKTLLIAVAASFLLQVCAIYVPFLQHIFKTTAITGLDWLMIVLVAFTIFISEFLSERVIK